MSWLGVDIGGANLKAADGRGWAHSAAFPLWRTPHELSAAVADIINAAPAAERLAVSMTGELCDCFRTKAEGVQHILSAVEKATAKRSVCVYLVDGGLVSIDEARAVPHLAAASNWHALARFTCRFTGKGAGLLIDIGSTTTDIVPLQNGRPCPNGFTDTDRLVAGELVYTGVGRTPVCAAVRWLPWRGARCPVAAELFATTADAYVILDEIPEQPEATWTADGRPLTKACARARLARMICADASSFDDTDAQGAADHVRGCQTEQLSTAVNRVIQQMGAEPKCVVTSGSGEFLAGRLLDPWHASAERVSIAGMLGPVVSSAAAAHALAVIAREDALPPWNRPSHDA